MKVAAGGIHEQRIARDVSHARPWLGQIAVRHRHKFIRTKIRINGVHRAHDRVGQVKVDVAGSGVCLGGCAHALRIGDDGAMIEAHDGKRPITLGRHAGKTIRDETTPENNLTVERADAFGVFIRIRPVAKNAILDGDIRIKGIDSVVVPTRQHTARECEYASGSVMEINAVRVVRAVHFHDVGICAQKPGACDFRSHSRPCQHAVAKNQRRTTDHHDLAHGAAEGGHVRNHGAIESDRGIIRTECRSSAGVTLARCPACFGDESVLIDRGLSVVVSNLAPIQIWIRAGDGHRMLLGSEGLDCSVDDEISRVRAGRNAIDLHQRI